MPKISKRGQQEEFLGRCFDAGDAGESFRCSDCVGFMASRYSFYIFPDLTEEEYCAKLKYDIEIMNRLLTPLQGEDDPLGLPITATGGES